MTKRQIETRLAALGLRLEAQTQLVADQYGKFYTARWIVRPNTVGSCFASQVVPLRTLSEAADLVDMREIAARE